MSTETRASVFLFNKCSQPALRQGLPVVRHHSSDQATINDKHILWNPSVFVEQEETHLSDLKSFPDKILLSPIAPASAFVHFLGFFFTHFLLTLGGFKILYIKLLHFKLLVRLFIWLDPAWCTSQRSLQKQFISTAMVFDLFTAVGPHQYAN